MLVSAQEFLRACKLEGSQCFRLSLSVLGASSRASSFSDTPADLTGVPKKYHDFADVFSKGKADKLPPHQLCDLHITLGEGADPPIPPVYPLSQSELASLREFIDEHRRIGFIRPTNSPHGAPILFIKKKDGSLRLCVDFRALKKITKKDRYPLPLVTDLLDAPQKAQIYTNINLRDAYHLVWIAEGDKWKTAF